MNKKEKIEQILGYANEIAKIAFYLNGRSRNNYSSSYDNGYHPITFKMYNKECELKTLCFRRFQYNVYSFQALFPNAKNKPGHGPVSDISINLETGKFFHDDDKYMAQSLLGENTDEIEFMQAVLLAVQNELREMLIQIKRDIHL
jgi:hypothetical protein